MDTRNLEVIEKTRQEVKALLRSTEKDHQEITKYSFHFPTEVKKEVTRNFYLALDKMVHLDLKDLIDTIIDIIDEVRNKINADPEKESKVKEFFNVTAEIRGKLVGIGQKENPTIDDLSTILLEKVVKKKEEKLIFSPLWESLANAIKSLTDGAKKLALPEGVVWLCKELQIAIDSLRMHYSIHFRRTEIKELMNQSSTEKNMLVDYPAQEIEKKIPLAKSEALNRIAGMDPDESLPVVIWVLKKLLHDLNEEKIADNFQETKEVVLHALKILSDAEQKQRITSFMDVKNALNGISKEKILEDMHRLSENGKKIHLTENTTPLWMELSLLLAGLHLRFYKEAPKLKNSKVDYNSGGDWKDKAFYMATGLYKIHIGDCYFTVASKIEERIEEEKLKKESAHSLLENPSSKTIGQSGILSVSSQDIKMMIAAFYQVDEGKAELAHQVLQMLLKENKETILFTSNAIKAMLHPRGKVVTATFITKYLSQYDSLEVEDRVKGLKNCITTYNLPPDFMQLSKLIIENTERQFAPYLNSEESMPSSFKGAYHRMVGRKHSAHARELIKELKKMDNPKAQLEKLFNLEHVLGVEESGDLLLAVNEVLKDVFIYMRNFMQPENQADKTPFQDEVVITSSDYQRKQKLFVPINPNQTSPIHPIQQQLSEQYKK